MRTKWYEVHVLIKRSNYKNLFPMKIWCNENIGLEKKNVHEINDSPWRCLWNGPKQRDHYTFYFKQEKDAVLFKMRWV